MTATSTGTSATTFTNVTVYFADKMMLLLGNIIRDSDLDMAHFSSSRPALEKGLKTWLESGHLKTITLEIFKPGTKTLIRRWDLAWDKCSAAESGFWADVADIRYHMKKLGVIARECSYRFIVDRKPGYPVIAGWTTVSFADTSGLTKHSLGTTITAGGYGSSTSYWN